VSVFLAIHFLVVLFLLVVVFLEEYFSDKRERKLASELFLPMMVLLIPILGEIIFTVALYMVLKNDKT